MEFENTGDNIVLDELTTSLPNLIKENYHFRKDIIVDYAGDIAPYMDFNFSGKKNKKRMLINGKFDLRDGYVFISYEVYDVKDWESIVERTIYCPYNDLICIQESFLISIEETISPLLNDNFSDKVISDLEEMEQRDRYDINSLDSDENIEQAEYYDDVKKNIFYGLDNLSAVKDFHLSTSSGDPDSDSFGDRIYREFSFNYAPTDNLSKNELNTQIFNSVLDDFLHSPYDILIGDMEISDSMGDRRLVNVSVPIEYSIKAMLIEDLLTSLPHKKISNSKGTTILKLDNSNFVFDIDMINNISNMDYSVVPVLYFTDRKGRLQLVIIDSWNRKYDLFTLNEVPVIRLDQIDPLFAITPGRDDIQVTMDINTRLTTYDFTVPKHVFGGYTKMTMKFINENELDRMLSVSSESEEG